VDLELVAEVEAATYRAWRPDEKAEVASWRVHYSGGFSRRANSAAPPRSGPTTLDGLAAVHRWFAAKGLELVVRITPLVTRFDALLADRGFTREGRTDVMTVAIAPQATGDMRVSEAPSADWLAAQALLQRVPADLLPSWEGMIDRIGLPAGFALQVVDGEPVAAGFGVRDGDWIGLFEINVAPGHRRQGIGSRLSRALLGWGSASGARRAYLQVVHNNEPAQALYRSLGFASAYPYWYRRAPAEG
jgi:ribosomal protein S18 acetylase RimI-like enzyme